MVDKNKVSMVGRYLELTVKVMASANELNRANNSPGPKENPSFPLHNKYNPKATTAMTNRLLLSNLVFKIKKDKKGVKITDSENKKPTVVAVVSFSARLQKINAIELKKQITRQGIQDTVFHWATIRFPKKSKNKINAKENRRPRQ